MVDIWGCSSIHSRGESSGLAPQQALGFIPEWRLQPALAGPSDDVLPRAPLGNHLLDARHDAGDELSAHFPRPRGRRSFFAFAATFSLFLPVKILVGKMNGHTP